jgi:hypothetical protein
MFNAMADVLDMLCENWREVLDVTTDGDRSMTGQVRVAASRIERETPDGTICRVWCGLHQLDSIMQRLLNEICDYEVYRQRTSVIVHLRRQADFIENMGGTCPTVADSSEWLSVNRITLIEHYAGNPERLRPSRKWWLSTMAL